MAKPVIAIVGLGVIGTSLGLALKKAGGNYEIVGHDREQSVAGKARKLKSVDKTTWNLINATEGADMILLAVPVSAVEPVMKAISPYLKAGCLIIDTCAVKRPVLKWADELLPDTVNFVGGDPIVDVPSEDPTASGPELATETLFENAIFCLCPSYKTRPEAVQLASDLVGTLGAVPFFLDADEHDGLISGVDHLPALMSASLMRLTTNSPSWREMRKVAGNTFTRISNLPVDDAAALASTTLANSDNLVRWIDDLIETLRDMRVAIQEGDEELLEEIFETAIVNRYKWLRDRAQGFSGDDRVPSPEVPSHWKAMFGMGGGLFRRRGQDQEPRDEKRRR